MNLDKENIKSALNENDDICKTLEISQALLVSALKSTMHRVLKFVREYEGPSDDDDLVDLLEMKWINNIHRLGSIPFSRQAFKQKDVDNRCATWDRSKSDFDNAPIITSVFNRVGMPPKRLVSSIPSLLSNAPKKYFKPTHVVGNNWRSASQIASMFVSKHPSTPTQTLSNTLVPSYNKYPPMLGMKVKVCVNYINDDFIHNRILGNNHDEDRNSWVLGRVCYIHSQVVKNELVFNVEVLLLENRSKVYLPWDSNMVRIFHLVYDCGVPVMHSIDNNVDEFSVRNMRFSNDISGDEILSPNVKCGDNGFNDLRSNGDTGNIAYVNDNNNNNNNDDDYNDDEDDDDENIFSGLDISLYDSDDNDSVVGPSTSSLEKSLVQPSAFLQPLVVDAQQSPSNSASSIPNSDWFQDCVEDIEDYFNSLNYDQIEVKFADNSFKKNSIIDQNQETDYDEIFERDSPVLSVSSISPTSDAKAQYEFRIHGMKKSFVKRKDHWICQIKWVLIYLLGQEYLFPLCKLSLKVERD